MATLTQTMGAGSAQMESRTSTQWRGKKEFKVTRLIKTRYLSILLQKNFDLMALGNLGSFVANEIMVLICFDGRWGDL